MDALAFEPHLSSPQGRGRLPADGFSATAGGGPCCDEIRMSLRVREGRVEQAGFEASGCGAATAAGSAAVTLAQDRSVFDAATIGVRAIASELGGLSPGKLHAAELASDALARALGLAVAAGGAAAEHPDRTLVAMSGGVD